MTDQSFTLAHISDLHLPPARGIARGVPLASLNLKRTLGLANWYRYRRKVHVRSVLDAIVDDMMAHRPDHVVVTGDLVNLGLPHEHKAALAWLTALGSPERVSVVPGNHDTYVRLRDDIGHGRWQAYMTGDDTETVGGANEARAQFPFVRRRGPMALVGLGSGVPTPPFVSAGHLGQPQIAALRLQLQTITQQGLLRVVALHHPPHRYAREHRSGLRDAAALEALLAEVGAEIVLHGHFHRALVRWIEGSAGRVPVVGVPSASAAIEHKGDLAGYNLIVMKRGPNAQHRIELIRRGLARPGGAIVERERVVLSP